MAVVAVAAAGFAVLITSVTPSGVFVRFSAYLTALAANQTPAVWSAVHQVAIGGSAGGAPSADKALAVSATHAVIAVWTFYLMRGWVTYGKHRAVARRRLSKSTVWIGGKAAGAFLVAETIAGLVLRLLTEAQIGTGATITTPAVGAPEHGLVGLAEVAVAGAVEEPVYVGTIILLWPRVRAMTPTFVALALISSVPRIAMHVYYAAGAENLVPAIGVVALWCAIWSCTSLWLVYRTRMLWPVVVGHGINNIMVSIGGS
ncbi:hypothetical protein EB73_07280 [Mycobacterium sp. SWH-M3]|nr:hypothetical protein EB73_07280 [Mycobacterium sp. SWH-M3]